MRQMKTRLQKTQARMRQMKTWLQKVKTWTQKKERMKIIRPSLDCLTRCSYQSIGAPDTVISSCMVVIFLAFPVNTGSTRFTSKHLHLGAILSHILLVPVVWLYSPGASGKHWEHQNYFVPPIPRGYPAPYSLFLCWSCEDSH